MIVEKIRFKLNINHGTHIFSVDIDEMADLVHECTKAGDYFQISLDGEVLFDGDFQSTDDSQAIIDFLYAALHFRETVFKIQGYNKVLKKLLD